jgi:hypothetical protein
VHSIRGKDDAMNEASLMEEPDGPGSPSKLAVSLLLMTLVCTLVEASVQEIVIVKIQAWCRCAHQNDFTQSTLTSRI